MTLRMCTKCQKVKPLEDFDEGKCVCKGCSRPAVPKKIIITEKVKISVREDKPRELKLKSIVIKPKKKSRRRRGRPRKRKSSA